MVFAFDLVSDSELEGPTGLIRTGLPGCDSFGQGAGGVPIEG